MSDQRTKASVLVSRYQSALTSKYRAEDAFTKAHDELEQFFSALITENEELRKVIAMEAPYTLDAPFEGNEELVNLRRKLGLVTP